MRKPYLLRSSDNHRYYTWCISLCRKAQRILAGGPSHRFGFTKINLAPAGAAQGYMRSSNNIRGYNNVGFSSAPSGASDNSGFVPVACATG